MNKLESKRGFTINQVNEMGFPKDEYSFPTSEGTFCGTLVMKMWGKANNLICFFELENGDKIMVSAFNNHDKDKAYAPKKSRVRFTEIEIGTKWEIAITKSKTGELYWTGVTAAGGESLE